VEGKGEERRGSEPGLSQIDRERLFYLYVIPIRLLLCTYILETLCQCKCIQNASLLLGEKFLYEGSCATRSITTSLSPHILISYHAKPSEPLGATRL